MNDASHRSPSPGHPLRNVTNTLSTSGTTKAEDTAAITLKLKPAPRKRPAPKKGMASKPAAKKRKLETGSGNGTPLGQRTGIPATRRVSGTPAPKNRKQTSATPTRSSSVAIGVKEDEDNDTDNKLFCVCRGPDDHSMIIGCDGPSEDWFYTRCVEMNAEKVELIFKWYCTSDFFHHALYVHRSHY